MKILLIQYQMLGDVLTSTIIADQLKISYPDSHIDYLIVSHARALTQHHPSIDGVVAVTKADLGSMKGIISLSRKLKKAKYDLLIDVYGKNNTALLSYLTGIPKRIGYKKWFSSIAYTTALKNDPDNSVFNQGTSIGSRLLLTQPLVTQVNKNLLPKIYLTADEIEQGKSWIQKAGLDLSKPITMISVLGSSMDKTLPFLKMALLLDEFVQMTDTQVLFNYIPNQKKEAYEVYNQCAPETQNQIFIEAFAAGIREFLMVLANCDALIGNEGGAVNMAKALNIPTFTIFSPWINKAAWNASEDGEKHVSVHLKDFKPEIYRTGSYSEKRKIAFQLYEKMEVADFKKPLQRFVATNYKV